MPVFQAGPTPASQARRTSIVMCHNRQRFCDMSDPTLKIRPSITNPALWNPERPPKSQRNKIRKSVLERDDWTCAGCGHRAKKYMHIHHVGDSEDNSVENLITLCVACHAALHIGRNLDLKTIEIWNSEIPQAEIVRRTRQGIEDGMSLEKIKSSLPLSEGPYPPDSIIYAKNLLLDIGDNPEASLNEPLCAVFVNFKQWQIENGT